MVALPDPVPAPVEPTPLPPTLDEARALKDVDAPKYERALRGIAASSNPTAERQAQTLLALSLFEAKRYAESVDALQTAAASHPKIAPYLQLRVIDATEALGRVPEAIVAANTIINTAPSSSAATIAQLELPALYALAGDEANMNAALAQVAAISIDELTEAEFVSLATNLAKAGKTDRATEMRMRILRDMPNGRYVEQVYSQLTEVTPSPIDALSTEDATRLASSLSRANRYDQTLDLLRRIGSRPEAQTASLYQNVRVRALFNSRNYTQLLSETEGQKLDAPLQLLRARAAWRTGRDKEFLAALDQIEKKFPRTREAIDAKVHRAKYYATDEVNYAKSTQNLEAAIKAGALGNDGENLWNLGFTYVVWGKYDDALRIFERYARDYPDGDYKMNVLFWSGKIHDRRGNVAERDAALNQLIFEYPYNYYSYRAKEILGGSAARGPRPETLVFPAVEAELAKVSDPRLDAVRELLAVDMNRDATREMKAIAAAYPDNIGIAFMQADVYSNGDEVFEAINIVQRRFRTFVRHGGANIPLRLWQILYPLDYWDVIRTEAQKRNLDPFLVASIIRQESGFEPTVVSNAGAVGLMQIMPGEVSRIAAAAGLSGIDRKQLFDPITNIAVGAAEYSQKLSVMRGNDILAIAAYNAGEDAVGRWLAQRPIDGDPDIFVDSIPYAETRLYVKSVTRNRFEYRRVYEGSTAVSQAIGRSSDTH